MTRTPLLAWCAALLMWGAPAHAGDDAVRADLEARYALMKAAMAAHDPAALRALLAPGFTSVDITGHSASADEVSNDVAAIKADPNKVSQTTLVSVSVKGHTAVVVQRYDMTSLRAGPDGVMHPVHLVTLSTDTWTQVHHQWLALTTRTDEVDYEVEGQAPVHRSRPGLWPGSSPPADPRAPAAAPDPS